MFPDNPQNQQNIPVSLPSVSPTDQPQAPSQVVPQGPQVASTASSGQVGGGDTATHYAIQARRIVGQYDNDPYKLSVALSQLKSAYLTEQYHITPNQTGD
jgi:hypothetical protein